MRARCWLGGAAVWATVAIAPIHAYAQDEGGAGFLSGLRYCAGAGIMSGAGPQGRNLWRGPYFAFNVHGESALGMVIGLEGAYAASDDILRTRFTSIGGFARLSPMSEDYRAYVQLGAVLSHVTYDPKAPELKSPGTTTRPGGSFGVGYDVIELSNLAIGGIVTFNGVVFKSNSAQSYLVVALNVTFKPSY